MTGPGSPGENALSRTGEAVPGRRAQTAMPSDLSDLIPGVIWMTDTDLRFVWIAGKALFASGVGANELIGRSLSETLKRGGSEQDESGMAPVAAHERALAGEPLTSYQILSDTAGELRCYVAPIVSAGEVTGCFGCGFMVGTEELSAPPRPLLDLRTTDATQPVPYLLSGPEPAWHLIEVSSRVEELLAFSRRELLEDPELLERRVHSEDRDRLEQARLAALADCEPHALEYRLIAWGGEAVTVADRLQRSRTQTGKPALSGSLTLLRRDVAGDEHSTLLEAQAERILARLERRGLPTGAWLFDVSRARDDMQAIDRLLYRLERMLVNEPRAES